MLTPEWRELSAGNHPARPGHQPGSPRGYYGNVQLINRISLPGLEQEVAVAEGRVRSAVDRVQVRPDHVLEVGDRTYFYFHRDRIEEVRLAIGAPKLEEHTLRD